MMKKLLLPILLMALILSSGWVFADGYPGEISVKKKRRVSRKPAVSKVEPLPPPPSCIPTSKIPRVRIVSYQPVQRLEKVMGEITECVTTQWEVLDLLGGMNSIGLSYPDEKEMWGYQWMWGYRLENPIEETLILMDQPGRRIRRGKNPVELFIVFNDDDIVERVEMNLIKR